MLFALQQGQFGRRRASTSAAPAYRYIRLYITANDGDANFTSLTRLALFVGATEQLEGNISGGEYDQSSVNGTDYAIFVCNQIDGDEWVTASGSATPSWIAFDLSAAVALTSYKLKSQRVVTGRAPTAWKLQGNNSSMGAGETWIDIDSRSGETGWAVLEERTYTI